MVKADAYNHGVEGVVCISNNIVDRYGVATLDEAIKLRQMGVAKPINLFSFESKDIEEVIKYHITPVVYNEPTLLAIEQKQYSNFDIKIDTGMNRFGFKSHYEFQVVFDSLKKSGLEPRAIHTHFYSNESVLEQKDKLYLFLKDYSFKNSKIIASASLGISRGIFLDGVRVGLMAYHNALEVQSEVLSVKEIGAYERVGYDGSYVPNNSTRTAVISGGYFDGISRSYKGAKVLINDKYATIVGKVCMDTTIIDVGEIPIKIGDKVVVLSPRTIDSYINSCNSSEYEVITSIKGRGKRIYSYNGQSYNKVIDKKSYLYEREDLR